MLPFSIINQYGNIIQRNDYERFILELQSSSTDKLVTYNQSYSLINASGAYDRVYMYGTPSVTGTMWGTSYGNKMTWDSTFCRVIQHAFPTQDLYNDFLANGSNRVVCFVRSPITSMSNYISLTRNGYTSSAYATFSGCTITQFIYYDNNSGRVMTYDPSTISTPTFYYS